MNNKFLQQLDTRPLLCDGAMGTMIYSRGIPFERCFDELNLTNPVLIADVHQAYINAGADVIETNTFGANRLKLGEHGLAHKFTEINNSAAQLARRVVDASFKEVFVAGSIGWILIRFKARSTSPACGYGSSNRGSFSRRR